MYIYCKRERGRAKQRERYKYVYRYTDIYTTVDLALSLHEQLFQITAD